jgi:hypothetical protein
VVVSMLVEVGITVVMAVSLSCRRRCLIVELMLLDSEVAHVFSEVNEEMDFPMAAEAYLCIKDPPRL